jgi:hypothetical protein
LAAPAFHPRAVLNDPVLIAKALYPTPTFCPPPTLVDNAFVTKAVLSAPVTLDKACNPKEVFVVPIFPAARLNLLKATSALLLEPIKHEAVTPKLLSRSQPEPPNLIQGPPSALKQYYPGSTVPLLAVLYTISDFIGAKTVAVVKSTKATRGINKSSVVESISRAPAGPAVPIPTCVHLGNTQTVYKRIILRMIS